MLAWVSPTLETAVYGFGSGIKLFVRMKAGYFLHNAGSSVSLPFCLSELCGGHGCVSCSVWVDRTCGKLRAPGVAADIQVSRRCNRWPCPGRLCECFQWRGELQMCLSDLAGSVIGVFYVETASDFSPPSSTSPHTCFCVCFSMEPSPPTQPAPVSSVLQASGLPESMTVGEYVSLRPAVSVFFISLSLRKNRFCVMNHRNFCHMWTSSNNSRPRAITGIQL